MGAEGILQPLLYQRVQHFIFGSDLVKGVVNYKFLVYARALLLEDLYHYLFLLVVFTGACLYAGYNRRFGWTLGPILTMVVVCLVGFGNLVHLVKQFYELWKHKEYAGVSYYLCDYMKWIEGSSYILVVFFVPIAMACLDEDSQLILGFMATASVLLWVKLLYYAQAFSSTGYGMTAVLLLIALSGQWL